MSVAEKIDELETLIIKLGEKKYGAKDQAYAWGFGVFSAMLKEAVDKPEDMENLVDAMLERVGEDLGPAKPYLRLVQ